MDDLISQIMVFVTANGWGTVLGVGIGILAPKFIPQLRAFASRTPSRFDDMAVAAMEACISSNKDKLDTLTVSELDKVITNEQLVALVRIRKQRIAEQKAANGKP